MEICFPQMVERAIHTLRTSAISRDHYPAHTFYPLPINVPPTSGIRPKQARLLLLSARENPHQDGFRFASDRISKAPDNSNFIFKRGILTLAGGRAERRSSVSSRPPRFLSCRGSQMVRFSAHTVIFLRDQNSWPDWRKKNV